MKHKMISLLLALSLLVSVCPASFAAEDTQYGESVLSSVYDETTGVLTLETASEMITLTFEDTEESTIITQYNDGVLSDQVICPLPSDPAEVNEPQVLSSLETLAVNTTHRYFMGTVHYTGGMNPTYTMNVKVYDTYTAPIQTEYTPPDGTLTAAQIIANAATVLGVPASFVAGPVGTIIAFVGLVSSGYVWWKQGKQPKIVCDKYNHTFEMHHYGTAPVYYSGQVITRTGTHYMVRDKNNEEQTKDNYYEGFFIHGPTAEDAIAIYHTMYSYPQWEFIRWNENV